MGMNHIKTDNCVDCVINIINCCNMINSLLPPSLSL